MVKFRMGKNLVGTYLLIAFKRAELQHCSCITNIIYKKVLTQSNELKNIDIET